MDKVWCVFSGEYSDIRLEGVFSSKDKAQNYIDMMKKYKNDWEIDSEPSEFTLDKHVEIENAFFRYDLCLLVNGKKEEFVEPAREQYYNEEDVFLDPSLDSDEYCTHLIVRVAYNPDENVMKKSVYDKVAKYFAKKENI